MTLRHIRFRYTKDNDKLIPYVRVVFHHQGRASPPIASLLDSGSDSVLLPMALARRLGLRCERLGRPIQTAGGPVEGFRTTCNFDVLTDRGRIRFNRVRVTVVDADVVPLIGRNPLFARYKILFEERHARFSFQREGDG